MKEFSILIIVQADTPDEACEAAATFLNNGGTPDDIKEGQWSLKKNL